MVRLSQLSELARKSALTHPCRLNDTTPWTVPSRPLAHGRLGLVTTAGLHLRSDRPFVNADTTYRVFPTDTPARDLVQSHVSIGFDRTAIQRDINVVLPLDRMRELVQQDPEVCSSNAEMDVGALGETWRQTVCSPESR